MDAKDNRFYREPPSTERHVLIDYTNHAGMRQVRTIIPDEAGIYFSTSQWHPEKQWLLNAYDVGKDDMRTFAVSSIHCWQPVGSKSARVDASIAKQLQASIERNGRMKTRLLKLYRHPSCPVDVQRVLESIDKDEEPAWHDE